jgi:hypothetical protein
LTTGAVVKHADPQLLPNDQLLSELGQLGLVDSLQQLQLPATAFTSRRRLVLAEFSRKKAADEVGLRLKFFCPPLLVSFSCKNIGEMSFSTKKFKIAKSIKKSEE